MENILNLNITSSHFGTYTQRFRVSKNFKFSDIRMLTICKWDHERELFCAETIRDSKEYFHYYNHFCNLHSNKTLQEKFPENNGRKLKTARARAHLLCVSSRWTSSGLLFVLLMASGSSVTMATFRAQLKMSTNSLAA